MRNSILDSPLLNQPIPVWLPFLSFFVILYGVIFLDWSLQPVVFFFWFEIILMSAIMLIRILFASDGKSFFYNLPKRILTMLGGATLACALIMLAVTFSFEVFEGGLQAGMFEGFPSQVRILTAGYLIGLILHYFANKQYKTANPVNELMRTLLHLFLLVILLMPLSMHLVPAYPEVNQAKWVGVSVVVVKFVVDLLFSGSRKVARLQGRAIVLLSSTGREK